MAIERTWLDVLADCTVDRLPYLSSRSYEERLRALELPTLHYRQLRGDMIQLYKYVNNKYDANFVLQLQYKSVLEKRYDTRGHRYKLVPQLCKYDFRKHFFCK